MRKLLTASLLLLGACADARDVVAPSVEHAPDAPAHLVAAGRADLLGWRLIERAGPPPQVVTIDLAALPHDRLMPPFHLYVEELSGPDVKGRIDLDGVTVLSLAGLEPGSIGRRAIAPTDTSELVVTIAGSVGAAIRLRIEGEIVPAPVITITSPARALMLVRGAYDASSPVVVRGEACDELFPITELSVNGTPVPASGADLCVPFAVTRQTAWGMTTIEVRARNARGREARRVQSLLRSPFFYAPTLALQTDPNVDSLVDVRYGEVVRFETPGWDKLTAQLPAWMDQHVAAIGSSIPQLISETHLPRRCSVGSTHRAYRVERGATASRTDRFSLEVPDAQTLMVHSQFDVVVPVTVTIQTRVDCGAVQTSFRHGTAQALNSHAHMFLSFGIHAAAGGVDIDIDHFDDADLSSYVFVIDLTAAGLTALQVSAIRAAVGSAFTTHVPGDVHTFLSHASTIEVPIEGLWLDDGSLAELGIGFHALARSVTLASDRLEVGFFSHAAPITPREGPAPRRGSIGSRHGPAIPPFPGDVSFHVSDDMMNQALWAGWAGGYFDAAAPSPTEGLTLELSSRLPPVLMPGADGRVRIGWGDVRVVAQVDDARFGLDSAAAPGAVGAAGYASVWLDAELAVDSLDNVMRLADVHADARVELASPDNALLDEDALRAAIGDALAALALERIGAVLAAMPIARADASGFAGAPPGAMLDMQAFGAGRAPGFTIVGAALSAIQ